MTHEKSGVGGPNGKNNKQEHKKVAGIEEGEKENMKEAIKEINTVRNRGQEATTINGTIKPNVKSMSAHATMAGGTSEEETSTYLDDWNSRGGDNHISAWLGFQGNSQSHIQIAAIPREQPITFLDGWNARGRDNYLLDGWD